jgi:hypothetical protein
MKVSAISVPDLVGLGGWHQLILYEYSLYKDAVLMYHQLLYSYTTTIVCRLNIWWQCGI